MASEVIAIDGPAASGKSTVARLLAARCKIPYINTGNLYRAITLFLLDSQIPIDSASIVAALNSLQLDYHPANDGTYELTINGINPGEKLRSPEVAAHVSEVAAIPAVRDWLLNLQRRFAENGLMVMEGRDIGTIIFPDAKYKYFITASPEERARRRLAQSGENPDGATLESVAAAIAERDRLDASRAVAPLRRAEDATLIDTTGMTIEQVIAVIMEKIK